MDTTLHEGHARKLNSRCSQTKGTVFSGCNRKPHTLCLEACEAFCCISDSLIRLFSEAILHEMYV